MTVKTNTAKGQSVRDLPVSIEAVQLVIQNAERLLDDSENVSNPTKFSLLEIGLEEIAKAWGLLMILEKSSLDEMNNFLQNQFNVSHFKMEKFHTNIEKIIPKINRFFSENNPNTFLIPFDSQNWYSHKAKIKYLSKLIEYIRDIVLPLTRTSTDREKAIKDNLGGYISTKSLPNFKEIDNEIDRILMVDEKQLLDIVGRKEKGLYVDIEGDSYLSPSSVTHEIETLKNLLGLLIGMAKVELKIMLETRQKINSQNNSESDGQYKIGKVK